MSDKIDAVIASMGWDLDPQEWADMRRLCEAALAQQPAPAVKIDEQAEFEKWRSEAMAVLERNGYPEGAKAFYNLGSVQWGGWQARALLAAAPAAPAPAAQEPVAWGAFHFGGKRDGKLYGHADTEAQIDAYILDVHRSSDSVTLRKGPLYATPPAAEQPYSTTSDKYRAELYDEVWEKARSMGHSNVTEALAELERMRAAEQFEYPEDAFEVWWESEGQYCRAGGGDYEKSFGYAAWQARSLLGKAPETDT